MHACACVGVCARRVGVVYVVGVNRVCGCSFSQIGHKLANGSGEHETVTGANTKHKQESVHVGPNP